MPWGLITGDAFGNPVQFSPKDDHPYLTEMEPCSVFRLSAAYWTEDGSVALCVMDSYDKNRLGLRRRNTEHATAR